jgi:hypothetical protein
MKEKRKWQTVNSIFFANALLDRQGGSPKGRRVWCWWFMVQTLVGAKSIDPPEKTQDFFHYTEARLILVYTPAVLRED